MIAQVARGSHEKKKIDGFEIVRNGSMICSTKPSYLLRAKSWLPKMDYEGFLIPH